MAIRSQFVVRNIATHCRCKERANNPDLAQRNSSGSIAASAARCTLANYLHLSIPVAAAYVVGIVADRKVATGIAIALVVVAIPRLGAIVAAVVAVVESWARNRNNTSRQADQRGDRAVASNSIEWFH